MMLAGLNVLASFAWQGQDLTSSIGLAAIMVVCMGGGAKDRFVWLISASARWPPPLGMGVEQDDLSSGALFAH